MKNVRLDSPARSLAARAGRVPAGRGHQDHADEQCDRHHRCRARADRPVVRGRRQHSALRRARGRRCGSSAPKTAAWVRRCHAELRQQVRDVVLHRLLGQEHPLGDLAVGEPSAIRARILRSCPVSRARRSSSCRLAHPVEHPLGDGRIEQRLPVRDAADRVDDVGPSHLLQEVAGRAGHDRLEERLVVGERRQHEALDLGMGGTDLAADLDAGTVGELHVEDRHVGLVSPGSAPLPPPR